MRRILVFIDNTKSYLDISLQTCFRYRSLSTAHAWKKWQQFTLCKKTKAAVYKCSYLFGLQCSLQVSQIVCSSLSVTCHKIKILRQKYYCICATSLHGLLTELENGPFLTLRIIFLCCVGIKKTPLIAIYILIGAAYRSQNWQWNSLKIMARTYCLLLAIPFVVQFLSWVVP